MEKWIKNLFTVIIVYNIIHILFKKQIMIKKYKGEINMKNNTLKIMSLVTFLILLVIAFVYFQVSDKQSTETISTSAETITEKQEKLKETEPDEITLEETEDAYNSWLDEREELIDTRLDFDKDISFVYVAEINSHVINTPDVYTNHLNPYQFSFNEETESIYFYNDKNIPSKEDNLMVLHDINEIDIMLEHRVFKSNEDVQFRMGDVRLEGDPVFNPIYAEGRLFRDSKMSVEVINNEGDVEVKVDDKTHVIKVNDAISVVKKDKPKLINGTPNLKGIEFTSKLVITNYGKWNSRNMSYVVNYKDFE